MYTDDLFVLRSSNRTSFSSLFFLRFHDHSITWFAFFFLVGCFFLWGSSDRTEQRIVHLMRRETASWALDDYISLPDIERRSRIGFQLIEGIKMTWLSTSDASRDCHLALTYIGLGRNTESTTAMLFLSLSLFILIDWLCFLLALSEIRDSSCFIEHGRSPCEKLELTFFSSSSSKWVAGIPFSHSMLLGWERWVFLLSWLLHRSSGKALVWGSRLIFPTENIVSWRCPDMHWSRVGKRESIEISRCFMFLFVVLNSDQWRTNIILLLSLLEILDDFARMCLLLSSSLVLFLWKLCLAIAVYHDQQPAENLLVSPEHFDQCKSVGNFCETNNDCCSSLICYAIEGRTSLSLSLPCWFTFP